MINNELLKQRILDLAIRGKLVGNDLSLEAIDVEQTTGDIPFDIPTNWRWVSFCNIASIVRGGSPRPIKDYLTDSEDGINWIKIGDTNPDDYYINNVKEKIKSEGIRKSRYVEKGSLLLTNSMSFGRPYILNVDGCIHDGWLNIKDKANYFDNMYIVYLLSSKYFYDVMSEKSSGSVVSNLNIDKVKTMLISVPPLEEQHRIVAKIEELFGLIDKKEKNDREKSVLKKVLKQRLLDSAIHGTLIENDLSLDPMNVESISEDIPFDIPSNWKWTRFENLGEITSSKRVFQNEWTDYGVPFYRARDIVALNKGNNVSELFISEKMYNEYAKKYGIPSNGDILLTGVGTIGESYIVRDNDRFYFKDGNIIWFQNRKCVNPNYLKLFFESQNFYNQIYETAKGATVLTLTISHAKDVLIPIPPLEEQKRIVKKMEECFELINQL